MNFRKSPGTRMLVTLAPKMVTSSVPKWNAPMARFRVASTRGNWRVVVPKTRFETLSSTIETA